MVEVLFVSLERVCVEKPDAAAPVKSWSRKVGGAESAGGP
jgi:hypothetical protein